MYLLTGIDLLRSFSISQREPLSIRPQSRLVDNFTALKKKKKKMSTRTPTKNNVYSNNMFAHIIQVPLEKKLALKKVFNLLFLSKIFE